MTPDTAQMEDHGSIRDRLFADRRGLLDLGTRNRLIDLPLRSKGIRTVEIVDENAAEIHRLLTDGKAFTFLPGRELTDEERAALAEDDAETGGIPQPEETDQVDERGVAKRHSDTRLQTRLTSEGLQKRLFDIWYNARTVEEEQGVNVLYLAFGLLRWYETDTSERPRHAPIVLQPVRLDRTSAADRFTLRARSEPAAPNLSLQAMMNAEHGLRIEGFKEEDDLDILGYIAKVAVTVSSKARWQVLPDSMVLGFFSFAKYLMYRDLDPETWPETAPLDRHPLIGGLLGDGFEAPPPIFPETGRIDAVVHPLGTSHVVDADSSQTIAIEEIARGRNLVVKGPPGTGKSQTITNVIAAAAAQGKSVLFVAEKMAALDVVHRRLRDVGLAALALELHSSKANKRVVLEELKRTKEASARTQRGDATVIKRLTDARDTLNLHADMMHTAVNPSGLTPFRLIGHLLRIKDGSGLPGIPLQEPVRWTPSDLAERKDVLEDIAERLRSLGDPMTHAWRGVRRLALDPSEIEQIRTDVASLIGVLDVVTKAASGAARLLGMPEVETVAELEGLARMLRAIARLPACDRSALDRPVWRSRADAADAAVNAGRAYANAKLAIDPVFRPAAWTTPVGECRAILNLKGRSFFRWLDRSYRKQVSLLRSIVRRPPPIDIEVRLAMIDALISAQEAHRSFETIGVAGVEAFGSRWKGEFSDWDQLSAIVEWRNELGAFLPGELLSRIARLQTLTGVNKLAAILEQWTPRLRTRLEALTAFLELDLSRAFGASDLGQNTLASLAARFDAWRAQPETISRWITFFDRARAANELGLGRLMHGLLDGWLVGETLLPTFERSYYEAVRTDCFARLPALKRFDGELHDRLAQSFRNLDVDRIGLAREQIAVKHSSALPRISGGIGPLGVLNGELAKKRNHLPIRQLLDKAGPVIQQIKPIFMMSPLSVAQFLKPGALTFDLLVIDEASQVEPVDALGAFARCRQAVVVGDERQLPPTRFFSKLTSDTEERDPDDDSTFQARDAESVLDLCLAKGMPHRVLNWHYRSRHHSLIAVSNREFYENRLLIVPSPYDATAGMGLKFHHLPDAHYERGGSRTNPKEARTVAEAVMAHARDHPKQSLGVATFSVAQRQAILNQLELLRRASPETEAFFEPGSTESFFVKNLENIQGDERDMIMISVGYGRTADGKVPMSFGPLNGDGGERRLNVLISRAKIRCEVFSSITAADLDPDRIKSRGVAALRTFLGFAETGRLNAAEATSDAETAPFEQHVAEQIRALGLAVTAKVGMSGFCIDLAVADPQTPGRYILGIDCDGEQYRSSRSARDRDRLRQQVAESQGWVMHRIWAADWYLRPGEEIAKLQAAIAAAKSEWRVRDQETAGTVATAPTVTENPDDEPVAEADEAVAEAEAALRAEESSLAVPYEQAALSVRRDVEPHEVSPAEMADHVSQVVSVEGPVHETEIVTRIRAAWGLARSGSRIREAVQAGIDLARRDGVITGGPFYSARGQDIRIRNRSEAASANLRKPEFLPPEEIDAALLAVVEANFGGRREQLVLATARLFGFNATSPQLRTLIESRIEQALSDGSLRLDADVLVRSKSTEAEPGRMASAGAM